MRKYEGSVKGKRVFFKEQMRDGSGYDIQDQALARLGPEVLEQFNQLTTSGQIRAFTREHQDALSPDEKSEFVTLIILECSLAFRTKQDNLR